MSSKHCNSRFLSSMDNLDCSVWCEDGDFTNSLSRISSGYSSSIPLQITNDKMSILSSTQFKDFASCWPGFGDELGDDGTARVSSSKSHSEAEKRRRDRINMQLQTLRRLIPKSEKMDKASLLASAVHHVKDLKSKAAEVSKAFTIPTDVDEVRIRAYAPTENTSTYQANLSIEVSICCEDRPELLAELGIALQSLKLLVIQAEMASLGCRVQIELLLSGNGSSDETGESELNNLKRTLRAALNRVVNSTQSVTSYRVTSKRQRFFLPKADN